MRQTAVSLPEGLREALGQVIAGQRREWAREREVMEAQSRATIAELRAEVVGLKASVEEMVRERLASLRDGRDGVDGAAGLDGADGRDGIDGQPGRDGLDGAPGRDGVDGAPGRDGTDGKDGRDADPVTEQQIDEAVARCLAANPPAAGRDGAPGEPGRPGDPGEPGRDGRDAPPVTDEQIAEAAARWLEANPPAPGRDGLDGKDGAPGRDGTDGVPGRDGIDGNPGKDGEPGREGPPGRLELAGPWSDRVHYQRETVTHLGGTWQARRDTGRAPPHEDWCCLAAAGRDGEDGRSFNIRGTWEDGQAYRHLDVVALNGAAFAARHDEPGPCPGNGWQMIAAQGKRGNPGEPGRAIRGEPGPAGVGVVDLRVDGQGLLTLTNGDGTTVELDLYPLLEKIGRNQ